jgi:methionyl-tRNA formyltransferase
VENIQKRLKSEITKRTRLRILFCGSDSFSTTVLHELRRTKEEEPGLYDSIRLVPREPARVGRGRKVSNEGTDWNVCD